MFSFLRKKGDSKKTDSLFEKQNMNLVQKSSIFDELTIDIPQCQNYLVALLTAILNGQKFSAEDISTIFFSITKVYDNKDIALHRYLLLVLRYLEVDETFVFMITQSVIKDISNNYNDRRAFAVRLVPHIVSTENQLLTGMDRFIKEIIISKNPYLSISGLSCVLSLCFKGFTNEVKKWITEIHTVSTFKNSIQHYAFLVLYYLRRGDGNFLRKMADQAREKGASSYMTDHVLVQVCSEAYKLTKAQSATQFLAYKLQSAKMSTQLDAARAILANESSPDDLVSQTITKLNTMLLSCSSSIGKFAILRTIIDYAADHRNDFSKCNPSLERLLSDKDRNISTFAAIALLHTGFESTIDQVLPVVAQFSNKLSTDQQSSILKSCAEFARRHPAKLEFILTFMWSTFRQIDIYDVQYQLVEGFMSFVETLKNSASKIFRYLCEYLEDSKFTRITLQIVNFIGEKGPAEENRTELVRCLCNRLYLENAEVRASTIDALAKFLDCPDIRNSVLHVIKKHLNDSDDEVRERAVFYNCCSQEKYSDLLNIAPPQVVSEVVEEKPVIVIKETPLSVYGNQPLYQSKEMSLTPKDDEIVVSYIVHVYLSVVAVEFIVKNTLNEPITNIKPELDEIYNENGLTLKSCIDCSEIEKEASVYAIFERTEPIKNKSQLLDNFVCGQYKFSLILDTSDVTEYQINFDKLIYLTANVYMNHINVRNFDDEFRTLGEENEVKNGLTFETNTVVNVISLICESTGLDILSRSKGRQKNIEYIDLQLGGLFMDKDVVLAKLRIWQSRNDVHAQFTVRSNNQTTVDIILKSFK